MIHTMLVGDFSSWTPSGSVPFQFGPVMAYFWALSPVVRLPGTAKGEDRGLEERHDRGGRRERERHLWPLVLIARTHLLFGLVERRVRRGWRHGLARHAARERPLDPALCQAPMMSNVI